MTIAIYNVYSAFGKESFRKCQSIWSSKERTKRVSYWQYKINLPNEAFANIFCCKVLGLEEELAAMKRIFPESYQLYEEMVANIISNPKKNFESWLDNKVVLIMITLLSLIVGLTLICMKTRK